MFSGSALGGTEVVLISQTVTISHSELLSYRSLINNQSSVLNIWNVNFLIFLALPTYWPVNNILKANFQWWYNRCSVMTLSLKKIHVTECMSIFLPPLLLMHSSLCRRMFLFATKQKSPFGAKICADIIFPRCKQFSKGKAQEKLWA